MNKEDSYNIESEKRELDLLIEKGANFDVEEVQLLKPKGFFGFFKKRRPVKVKHHFHIEEAVLRTLDLISAESIQMEIDEAIMIKDGLSVSKKLANEHSIRCAKVVALAALGSSYILVVPKWNGTQKIKYNDKELNRLTELFARTIKPTKLFQLVMLVNTMLNLGDFTNSIRLMSGARTTMPNRIEEEAED